VTPTLQNVVRHLDLFSGIGGFALAARMCGGIETDAFCECNPFAVEVLKKNFPNTPIYPDVRDFNGNEYRDFCGADLITAGFPCTDLSPSSFGSHAGLDGEESGLFWELTRIVLEVDPQWVVIENVPKLIKYFDTLKREMLFHDWDYRVFEAADFGTGCRRKRAFFVGHPDEGRSKQVLNIAEKRIASIRRGGAGDVLPMCLPWKGGVSLERLASCVVENTEADSTGIREGDGVPGRLDGHRYLALGNAIVPQVAAEILKAMMQADRQANPTGHILRSNNVQPVVGIPNSEEK
jgi:DNA (cytosine-5)-methyltransferase 1